MFWIVWIFFVVIVLLILDARKKNYWTKRGVPGPKPWPIFGNVIQFLGQPNTQVYLDGIRKYGKVFGYMEFDKPILVVGEYKLLKDILTKDFHMFPNRKQIVTEEKLKTIMTYLRDEEWKRIRKLSTPAFSAKRIQKLVPHMWAAAKTFTKELRSKIGSDVDLRQVTSAYTVDVFARAAFGIATDCQENPDDEFLKNVHSLTEFSSSRMLICLVLSEWVKKLFRISIFPNDAVDYMDMVMRELYKRESQSETKAKTLIEFWLKCEKVSGSQSLSPEELTAQGAQFIMAGFETTATLTTMCFYALALDSHIQTQVYDEIMQHTDPNGNLISDDFSNLTYLDAFINEILRIYTPVVCWEREAASDYTLGETGITIEKGTTIITPYYAVHHDPDVFPDPDVIKPERFLTENGGGLVKNNQMAFGLGPRNCIGSLFALMETKALLVEVIQKFTVIPCKSTMYPPKFTGAFISLKFERLYVEFRPRVV